MSFAGRQLNPPVLIVMESTENAQPKRRRTVLSKIANVLSYIIVILVFLVILVALSLQTAPVQNFVRGKVQSYLQNKLKTKVLIGKLDVDFPNSVLLKNIYIEDQTKDTLLSGGQFKVDINMLGLLKGDIQIKEINVDQLTAKIKRVGTDTVFNYQFITDAFAGSDTTASTDTSSLKMDIDNIVINRTRIVYKDVLTGNDMDMYITHLDAPIETFDINKLYFNIPTFTLTGLRGYFHQDDPLKPVIQQAVAEAVNTPGTYLQLKNSEIVLKDIDFVYKSVPTNILTSLKINSFTAHPDTLNIKDGKFDFKDLDLKNADIGVVMSNKEAPPLTAKQAAVEESLPLFTISSDKTTIANSHIKMDNKSLPVLKDGMDYGHMDMTELNLAADNLIYNSDTISATITSGSMKEKSGFVLNELNADFLFTDKKTSLQNFLIKTPGSIIRNKALITYPSLAQLAANPDLLAFDLNFVSTSVLVKDLLLFAPMLKAQPAFANPNQTLMVNGRVYGKVSDLNFQDLRFKGFGNTTVFVTGSVKGLPDPNKFSADLTINRLITSRKDITGLLPPGTLPANITLPETIDASGTVKGDMNNLSSNLTVKTSLGSAKLNGTLINLSSPTKARYDYAITATSINLGKIMGDTKTFGTLSGNFKVKGSGLDPNVANATFSGVLNSFGYNQYTYKNVKLNGNIANKHFNITADINDPNIDLDLTADGIFNGTFPSIHLVANIDSIKTLPLHFTPQTLIYHGKIDGNFTTLDPDNLAGNMVVTNSILATDSQRFELDTLELTADNTPGNKLIKIRSDFMSAQISGTFKATQLADVFQQAIQPYYNLAFAKNSNKVDPYDFLITASVIDHQALHVFMPDLKKLDPILMNAHFSSTNGWNATVDAPSVQYGTFIIDGTNFAAQTKGDSLTFTSAFNQFKNGTTFSIYKTNLNGSLVNNNIDFDLNLKDKADKDKYAFGGIINIASATDYSFKLKPKGLLLNYNPWSINADNLISYLKGDVSASQFSLSKEGQSLTINSIGTGRNRPLDITFKDFNLVTLSGFVQSDSTLVNGLMNGVIEVKNIMVQPNFTTDLTVSNLSIFNDTLGNLSAKVNNNIANQFNADVRLTGFGNDISVTGNYFLKPNNQSSFDFVLDMKALQIKSLEGLSQGSIKDGRGNLYGRVALNGNLEKPNIDGKINFNEVALNVTKLNSLFKVDKEAIALIGNTGIDLSTFTIRDTANNAIVIDGGIRTPDYRNFNFDLTIKADNFQAINSTKLDNRLFYGKLFFSTDLSIKGTPTNPVVDGSLTVNNKTDFNVVLPQNEPGVVQRDGIVRFVDMDATEEDSLFMAAYDSLKTSPLVGFDVSVNLIVDPNAIFSVIVDEGNGDFLRLKGAGEITTGIDPSGKITMTGTYEISEGSYDLSFNLLKRKFLIEKGSKITWTGEPTTADIDVTAIYIANTSPYDLMQTQAADAYLYRTKLPFQVRLTMRGDLLLPVLTFDIALPESNNYLIGKANIDQVQYQLSQLRLQTDEMNKQVFALLLLNRFVAENPFASSEGGGGMNAGAFARQSVSKLLTEQLNQLAGNLIEGVDLNFDVASMDDYSTGTRQDRTNLNVGLSKRLLNDRLTVNVGSDFELEGPAAPGAKRNGLAGNVSIDYKLSKSGDYLLRAYRRNDYENAVQGYLIETGIGFIISVDYNTFKELFNKKRIQAQRAARRLARASSKQLINNPEN